MSITKGSEIVLRGEIPRSVGFNMIGPILVIMIVVILSITQGKNALATKTANSQVLIVPYNSVPAVVATQIPEQPEQIEVLAQPTNTQELVATPQPTVAATPLISPIFSPEIQYWALKINAWSTVYGDYGYDTPNMLATVMQIESCGNPNVGSPAGAQGLFQVMPFHFKYGENMLDPDTNAKRGVNFLDYCLSLQHEYNIEDIGVAFACYNGGGSVFQNGYVWADETNKYYNIALSIYNEAMSNTTALNWSESDVMKNWNRLWSGLCTDAANVLGIVGIHG